ncbi:MAG: hypothetical protein IJN62_04645 [Clostridia bacterium]|nr:hypothetical protein [Clostridia bacterium]
MHNSVQITRYVGERLNAVVAPALPYCFSGRTLIGTVNVSTNILSFRKA